MENQNQTQNATELNNSLSTDAAIDGGADLSAPAAEAVAESPAPAPKKRGRPRKTPVEAADDKVADAKEATNANDDASVSGANAADLPTAASNTEAPAPAPKKRGRPRKTPLQTPDGAAEAESKGEAQVLNVGGVETQDAGAIDIESKAKSPAVVADESVPKSPDVAEDESEVQASVAAESDAQVVFGEANEENPDSSEASSAEVTEGSADDSVLSVEEQAQVYSYGDEIYAVNFFGEVTDSEVSSEDTNSADAENPSVGVADAQLSFFEEEKPKAEVVFNEIPPFIPSTKPDSAVKRKRVYNPEKPRRSDTAFDFIELLIISLVAVLILTSFFFRHSKVQGDSMLKTLEDGDHLIISDFLYKPQRGDIVVIEDFSTGYNFALVKRVIAVEGDRIVIANGKVYVNGELLDEPYVYRDGLDKYTRPINDTVPEGKIFVLGDHRNDSADSRVFGFVDEDSVIGKALIRVYPFDKFGAIEE